MNARRLWKSTAGCRSKSTGRLIRRSLCRPARPPRKANTNHELARVSRRVGHRWEMGNIMNASRLHRPAVVGLAGFLCLLTCGCLVTSTNNETRSGKYVADTTFDQIRPGKTSAAWVKATLGE